MARPTCSGPIYTEIKFITQFLLQTLKSKFHQYLLHDVPRLIMQVDEQTSPLCAHLMCFIQINKILYLRKESSMTAYSGSWFKWLCACLKSQAAHQLYWVANGITQYLQENAKIIPQNGHNHLLPHFPLSLYLTPYTMQH